VLMQMVKRFIGGFFLLLLLLWLFAPKVELYYLLEKNLKKEGIIISNESLQDTWFGLTIKNADIYVKGANMVHINELKLNIFFFYNTLHINTLTTDAIVQNVAPKKIENIRVTYSVLKPLKATLNGMGSFGTIEGQVEFIKKHIQVLFPVAKDIKVFKKFLVKDAKGVWKYETNY